MKKNNIVITILALSLLPIGFYLGVEYNQLETDQTIATLKKKVDNYHIDLSRTLGNMIIMKSDYEVLVSKIANRLDNPIIVEKVIEKPVAIYVDRYTNTLISFNPIATPQELARAKEAIRYGRASHQQFVDNPWLQNAYSGDVEFNILWVENYDLFKELIERAYGRGK